MAKKKKYIVTHSNYTVKKVHKKLDGDKTIYERDYTVLTNNGGWDSGTIAYGTPTFKMVNFIKPNTSRKHEYGTWLKQDVCVNETQNGEIWTLDCLPNPLIKSKESEIIINPNYNSLLDFAYFGSCSELIRTTITHIIETFPAELYVTDIKTEKGYVVSNPFGINIINKSIPINEDVNDLRYFCKSYYKYEIISGDTKLCVDKWDVSEHKNLSCYKNGDKICNISLTDDIKFSAYYEDGEIKLYLDSVDKPTLRIRPTDGVIENFFNGLDDFEKILLNRYTSPIYSAKFDYPHETDYGIKTYKKTFTWPISYDYNLNIDGQQFKSYVNDLLGLSEFYDNRQTNNMLRSMTHDSIKNMDLTYSNETLNEGKDDYNIGTTKVEGLLLSYGRQFDELKRYIDNIKSINVITYDGNNNIPHYLLSDKLELSGWEINSVSPSLDDSNKIGNLYSGDKRFFSSTDANVAFMRNLKINSKKLFSKKGTKRGIEELLSLFGLKSYDFVRLCNEHGIDTEGYDYKITEYVNIVNNNVSIDNVEKFNSWKKTFLYENDESSTETNTLQGLPVRMVLYGEKNSQGVIEEKRYLIPWFDKLDEKDGNPYFQMYGGWGKLNKKEVDFGNVTEIVSNKDNAIYDETIKYIKIVKKISELEKISNGANDGDIYYVIDIDDFDTYYKNNPDKLITIDGNNSLKASHYFVLTDKNYYTIVGHTTDNISGWENIPEDDIKESKNYGFKVLYLESIMDDYRGNNPHTGYGNYDDGREYLKFFETLFKDAIETNNFKDIAYDCNSGDLNMEIKKTGFKGLFNEDGSIRWVKDNMKVWYFTDTNSNYTNLSVMDNIATDAKMGNSEIYGNKTSASTVSYKEYRILRDQENVGVGPQNGFSVFESDITPYNFEGGVNYDEASANSIINNKKLMIEFSNKFINSKESYSYLHKCIMPFLKQMIPATTIFEISIEGGLAEYTCINNIAQVEGVS